VKQLTQTNFWGHKMNYEYEYNRERRTFDLYVNDKLVYGLAYLDEMTDQEAERLAEDVYIEYINKARDF